MILLIEIIFIALLGTVLFMIYMHEKSSSKKNGRKASLEEYWSGKDRRRHIRFNDKLEVSYTVPKKAKLKSKGHTIDISEGGLKILIPEKLGKGDILGFTITFPDNGRSANVEGEVVWSEEFEGTDPSGKRLFYSGVRFLAVKEPSGYSLMEYIHSLPSSSEVYGTRDEEKP